MENRFLIRKQKVSNNYLNSTARKHINSPYIWNSFETDPYHSSSENEEVIRIQIANMFPPFYAHGVPQYYNFGGIVHTIGHELSHALELINIPENLTEETNIAKEYSKWPEEFLKEYNKRKNCLAEQYSKFPLEGEVKINGSNSVEENFADNNGIILCLRVYEKYLKEHGGEPKLPGLEFNNRQMFFLTYSQTWCEWSDSKNFDPNGSYSPTIYRVFVPLMNSPEFSQAFECPLNSFMNPEDKCILWG